MLRELKVQFTDTCKMLRDGVLLSCGDDYSKLAIVSDGSGWVLDNEICELLEVCTNIGVAAKEVSNPGIIRKQCLFYFNRYFLFDPAWPAGDNRVATAYFHGIPGTGYPEFDRCYEALRSLHPRISRIQVPNREIRQTVLATGIDPHKVFLIPIGVNLDYFPLRRFGDREIVRNKLNIPHTSFVVGSFQKDGCGWEEGFEPKMVKGPDVFLDTVVRLKQSVPELFVLLSGPARGYVKQGLEAHGIPYRHVQVTSYCEMSSLYFALDAYLVSSRQEGGPKAVLESMASGIPLVTTRVGQATDLVSHQHNGWLADVEDSEDLAYWTRYIYEHLDSLDSEIYEGRRTAESNSYRMLHGMWREFMAGFVLNG